MKQTGFISTVAVAFGLLLILNSTISLAGNRSHGGHGVSGGHSGGHGFSGRHSGGHSFSGRRHGFSGGHHRSGFSRHGFGHRGYSYRHHGYGSSAWVPFAILGGAALAYTVSRSANNDYAYSRSSYYAPSRHGDSGRPCHVVHKVTEEDGGQIKMAATMCYDQQGTAYIVKGSEHVIAELN